MAPPVRDIPAAALDRLRSALWLGQLRCAGVELGSGIRLKGRPLVELAPGSRIAIGDRVLAISRSRDTALGVAHPVVLRTLTASAEITIGADSGLSGATVCASANVRIGERVLLGADVVVVDTDFHPVDLVPRRYADLPPGRPVEIGDDVFVGTRSIVLAGSEIGSGSVIGAGSVVTGSIPPGVVAAGNPCRVVRPLSDREAGTAAGDR